MIKKKIRRKKKKLLLFVMVTFGVSIKKDEDDFHANLYFLF